MQHKKWKVLQQQDISPSPWLPIIKEVVELPNGKSLDYYKTQLKNAAMVIPITKQKEIVFVRQYKHGIGEVVIEFPAGRIEKDQTPQQAAVLELRQETGIIVSEDQLKEVGELWTEPSKSTVRVFGFLVTDVEVTEPQNLEETEIIEVVKVPLSELKGFLRSDAIHASDTLGMLTLVREKFPEIFS